MSKRGYDNAKRRKIEVNYNASHLKRWKEYKSDMGVSRVRVQDIADYAECLLGEGFSSCNNYLSTVVTYEIDCDNVVADIFFERKYSKLRDRIRAIVGIALFVWLRFVWSVLSLRGIFLCR